MKRENIILIVALIIVVIGIAIVLLNKDYFSQILGYDELKDFSDSGMVEGVGNPGEACSVNEDCETPIDYLIQSNCPFGSACIDNVCRVVCPLTYHDLNPRISKSYPYTCEKDSDCDCSERQDRTLDCLCLEGICVSVEA